MRCRRAALALLAGAGAGYLLAPCIRNAACALVAAGEAARIDAEWERLNVGESRDGLP